MSQAERPLPTIGVVIPALNEEATIADQVAEVLAVAGRPDLPARIERVVVVDNGSTDRTAQRAAAAGATVVSEPRRGYGRACFAGVLAAGDVDLIVQMDGDRSDRFDELPLLLQPLLAGEADLVIGSRTLGSYEPGSLLPQQRFGNWLAAQLLRLLYGVRVTDIGPFRVIRRRDLLALGDAGDDLRLVGRDDRAGGAERIAGAGGAGDLPAASGRRIEGEREPARLRTSGRADHRHDLALPPRRIRPGVSGPCNTRCFA